MTDKTRDYSLMNRLQAIIDRLDPAIKTQETEVTIAAGESLSSVVDLADKPILGIIMPAEWTAANLSFRAAKDGSDEFKDIYNDTGAELVVQADAGRAIGIDVIAMGLAAWRRLRIRSGTASAPVVQEAERTLILKLKN